MAEIIILQLSLICQHNGTTIFHPTIIAVLNFTISYSQTLQYDLLNFIIINEIQHLANYLPKTVFYTSLFLHPSLYLSLLI